MKKRSLSDLLRNAPPVTNEMRAAGQLAFAKTIVKMREDFEKKKATPQWRAMEKLEAAFKALRADPDINVSESCTDLLDVVIELLDRAWPHHPIESIVQPLQKHFDGVKAKNAVDVRYQKDPKQAAKLAVEQCWKTWQNNPDDYDSKQDFAKFMREQFPVLKSDRKITDWCRLWEKKQDKS